MVIVKHKSRKILAQKYVPFPLPAFPRLSAKNLRAMTLFRRQWREIFVLESKGLLSPDHAKRRREDILHELGELERAFRVGP